MAYIQVGFTRQVVIPTYVGWIIFAAIPKHQNKPRGYHHATRTYGTYAIYRFCTLCDLRRRDHIVAVHACLATYIGRSCPYKGKWLAGWLGGWLPVISPVTIRRRGPATNGLWRGVRIFKKTAREILFSKEDPTSSSLKLLYSIRVYKARLHLHGCEVRKRFFAFEVLFEVFFY